MEEYVYESKKPMNTCFYHWFPWLDFIYMSITALIYTHYALCVCRCISGWVSCLSWDNIPKEITCIKLGRVVNYWSFQISQHVCQVYRPKIHSYSGSQFSIFGQKIGFSNHCAVAMPEFFFSPQAIWHKWKGVWQFWKVYNNGRLRI